MPKKNSDDYGGKKDSSLSYGVKKKLIDQIVALFSNISDYYIKKIIKQIVTIGKMNASSINRYLVLVETSQNISEVNRKLKIALRFAGIKLDEVLKEAALEVYADDRFQAYLDKDEVPEDVKKRVESYAAAVAAQTNGAMENLSNTTITDKKYREAVDQAVTAVTTGVDDYQSATRKAVEDLGGSGLQVEYPSGHKQSLDAAVRQNVVNAANQVAQKAADLVGESLGFDAVEISAHERPAPDHAPVQGRIFLKEQYDLMQSGKDCEDIYGRKYSGFKRPIGEWNCMHIAMPFSTQAGKPRYTQEQLDEMQERNKEGCEIDGKKYTLYQASQLMRRIEARVRKLKQAAVAAMEADDMTARRELQTQINALASKYSSVSAQSGIPMQKSRMQVSGFQAVRA